MATRIGFHGTTLSSARAMEQRRFLPLESRSTKWLGAGLYFFEDNIPLATAYAYSAQTVRGEPGAILRAEIDTSSCLDLTINVWHTLIRNAHRVLQEEWSVDESERKTQEPFKIYSGQVRAGYAGEWAGGKNALDSAVIERAIQLAKTQRKIELDTVRGMFLEEGPLFPSSWLFEGVHIAIAVRNPEKRLDKITVIEL